MIGRRAGCLAVCLAGAMVWSTGLEAQSASEGRMEVAAGAAVFGHLTFAPVTAMETTLGNGGRALFKTETALDSSPGVDVRVGARVTSRIRGEVGFLYSPMRMSTRVTADAEGAAAAVAEEAVKQFIVEGGLVALVAPGRRARFAPFTAVGLGYARQLNEGQTVVKTAGAYYVGGGTYYVLKASGSGFLKSAGVRADLRAQWLKRGVALDGGTHLVPFLGATVFVRY